MKMTAKHFLVKAVLALGLIVPFAARGQASSGATTFDFHGVTVSTAIENLARMTGMNYFIEPNLFTTASGTPLPEPLLTLRWENCTPADALARVLKENHLFMVTNDYTTVVHFTSTPILHRTVDVTLLGLDTNAALATIRFGSTPLDIALKYIISTMSRRIVLTAEVSGDAPPQPPDYKMIMIPMVSANWHNLTPYQVLVEICQDYDLVIVKGVAPDTLEIKPAKKIAPGKTDHP